MGDRNAKTCEVFPAEPAGQAAHLIIGQGKSSYRAPSSCRASWSPWVHPARGSCEGSSGAVVLQRPSFTGQPGTDTVDVGAAGRIADDLRYQLLGIGFGDRLGC